MNLLNKTMTLGFTVLTLTAAIQVSASTDYPCEDWTLDNEFEASELIDIETNFSAEDELYTVIEFSSDLSDDILEQALEELYDQNVNYVFVEVEDIDGIQIIEDLTIDEVDFMTEAYVEAFTFDENESVTVVKIPVNLDDTILDAQLDALEDRGATNTIILEDETASNRLPIDSVDSEEIDAMFEQHGDDLPKIELSSKAVMATPSINNELLVDAPNISTKPVAADVK